MKLSMLLFKFLRLFMPLSLLFIYFIYKSISKYLCDISTSFKVSKLQQASIFLNITFEIFIYLFFNEFGFEKWASSSNYNPN